MGIKGLNPRGFRRGRGGQLSLSLAEAERELLDDLLGQLIELISPAPMEGSDDPLEQMIGIQAEASTPTDPAVARLLPDAYDDPQSASDFRRYTERDLRATKRDNAACAQRTLLRPGVIELTQPEAMCWLAALNDLRLTLATRLGLTEENQAGLAQAPDPIRSMYLVYDWLTYHQDRLVSALAS